MRVMRWSLGVVAVLFVGLGVALGVNAVGALRPGAPDADRLAQFMGAAEGPWLIAAVLVVGCVVLVVDDRRGRRPDPT